MTKLGYLLELKIKNFFQFNSKIVASKISFRKRRCFIKKRDKLLFMCFIKKRGIFNYRTHTNHLKETNQSRGWRILCCYYSSTCS